MRQAGSPAASRGERPSRTPSFNSGQRLRIASRVCSVHHRAELLGRRAARRLPGGAQQLLAGRPMADHFLLRLRLDGLAGRFAHHVADGRQLVGRHAHHFQPGLAVGLPAEQQGLAEHARHRLEAQPLGRLGHGAIQQHVGGLRRRSLAVAELRRVEGERLATAATTAAPPAPARRP